MKKLVLLILVLCAAAGFAQNKQTVKTPVEILYGPKNDPTEKDNWPVISGVLNSKASIHSLPPVPKKVQELKTDGRVEVQLLVDEEGDVIFANPLSGPEPLWAVAVKAAVAAKFSTLKLANKPRKVTGRIIFDFKDGKIELPYKNGFSG